MMNVINLQPFNVFQTPIPSKKKKANESDDMESLYLTIKQCKSFCGEISV